MESLSLYISIKQCQLLTNKAVPVALHVFIATVTTFSVSNCIGARFQETFQEICQNRNTVTGYM